ncbi:MAG: primosomal protein N' [Rhodospirillales bacterium]|nr:primosomal protein N' [Rhodospirillales bacterium]
MSPRRVSVMLPLPFAGPLDYALADDAPAPPGTLVVVPLGSRKVVGVVWDTQPDADLPSHRLRRVAEILAWPGMRADLRRLVDWIAGYTLAPAGEVLAMALRPFVLEPEPPVRGWALGQATAKPSAARAKVLAALAAGPLPARELAAVASAAVIRGLAAAGVLLPVDLPPPAPKLPDPEHPGPVLSPVQRAAAESLTGEGFAVTLLDGVTGSGKTEVYFEAIAAALRRERQALVLLPEIALSAQWLERFERRFGVAPAIWHSELGARRRRETWRRVERGEAPVVIGARSALFLPFPELGLVVVDEEHETAFKQEEGVIYHARDMAIVRARLCGAPAVLVSATPSLETMHNVQTGRYRRVSLPARHGGAAMPTVGAIDLRATPPQRGRFLAPPLVEAVSATLARQEQAMLFLNRRGYAPLTLCRHCGHRFACPNCTAWLVEHRARGVLQCHHCGHTIPPPAACPSCGAADTLAPVGPGIERITEEVRERWPQARLLVMASDTLAGPAAAAEAARAVAAREVDLVIGTQIVAKGWHFPHLTLVGVVDADLGLGGVDLRSSERTFQLLHQVGGRAGRAEAPGRVLLQTWEPEHRVMRALLSGDFDAFMASEAAERQVGHWPPYGRLAALIVSAGTEAAADALANILGRSAPRGPGITVLGPAPAPFALLRGRHRRRLLLRTRRDIAPQKLLRAWLAPVRLRGDARIEVDIDPISFL